jgi:hypothetical protein
VSTTETSTEASDYKARKLERELNSSFLAS